MGSVNLGGNSVINISAPTSLILVSNSVTGTGRIAAIPATSSIVGNVMVQRYFPAKRSFRFLSSPIANATFASWQSAFYITGNGAGSDAGSTLPTVSYYNEPNTGNLNQGYYPISSGMSAPITVGSGFRVLVRGDRSLPISSSTLQFTSATLSVTGTINSGNISIPLVYTSTTGNNLTNNGWNLIGNPYPSQID